jgi:hypothetical protein
LKIGPDTYMLAKNGGMTFASSGELQTDLLREASAFCRSQSKHLLLSHSGGTDSGFAQFGNASIEFHCLAEGDPGLHRPVIRKAPDVVIQNQSD